jgi:hemerythrin-like domain-containing protein
MARESKGMERRAILGGAAGLGVAWLTAGGSAQAKGASAMQKPEKKEEEKVSPVEDLMREHGLLARVLLVYDEVLRRLAAAQEIPADLLPTTAGMVRHFVEDYHEKLEEDFVFPRFEKAGKLVDLVAVLRTQHQRGRGLTNQVMRLGTGAALKNEPARRQLADTLRQFNRLYRPHAAREDTVLFPEFRGLVGAKEYDALGEKFEEKEHALFGEGGFEKMVAEIAKLERALGIYELSEFTPKK